MLRAPTTATVGPLVGHDGFAQSAGALTGKTAAFGGVWAGAGAATDFTVETTGKTAQRTATTDADGTIESARVAISGASAMTATGVQIDGKLSAPIVDEVMWGTVFRYTDMNNFGAVRVTSLFGLSSSALHVYKRVGGSTSLIGSRIFPTVMPAATFHRLMTTVDVAGRVIVWFGRPDAPRLDLVMSRQDPVFATGGALASGKPGFFDVNSFGGASTRNYDDFRAFVPAFDAVLYPNQSAELRTDGIFREDTGGTSYARVESFVGSLPRLPPSGLENRKVELYVKASRGDLDQVPDFGIDDVSARVTYRPTWLLTPGS